MDISESEYSLEYTCCMSIDFLHTIETTLSDCTRKSWYLLDSYNSRIRDDDDIELVIDPVEEDKCQKHDPVYTESSPVESIELEYIDDSWLIRKKYPWTQKKEDKVKEVKHKNNPMTMDCHNDFFILF